jgi:lysyl-tRNA synthetase class 2
LRETLNPNPYPHKFHVTVSLPQFIRDYGGKDRSGNDIVPPGGRHTDVVSVAGRVHNIRASGAKLRFYDLHAEGVKIQIMASAK